MTNYQVYQDIQARTGGEIYIGVVGPVRCGKSTFIRRFMELLVLPGMDEGKAAELKDQLPLSGSGKLITTVEPKFIPKEAVPVILGGDVQANIRLIDCVGFMIPEATGNMEGGRERLVKTPWFEQEILFSQAAELGTRKVIENHATIAIAMTSDGTFGDIPAQNYDSALQKTVGQLRGHGKPFVVLVNSQKPYGEEARRTVEQIRQEYQVSAMAVNCEQLRSDDVLRILEKVLYEFPIRQVEFYIPKWVEMVDETNPIKASLLEEIRGQTKIRTIRDVMEQPMAFQSPYVQEAIIEQTDLSTGIMKIRIQIGEQYYYEMLSNLTGVKMESEYELMNLIREYARMKDEYVKVEEALHSVRGCGYGVVTPGLEEITIEEPMVIRQGNKFGVKIKSQSPSIHMIKADIETEIAPIVGTEKQAEDLIQYIKESSQRGESIWETNIFGKSIEQLVEDGIRNKIMQISDESQVKLQDTMKKIVNDSKGGMVCIII